MDQEWRMPAMPKIPSMIDGLANLSVKSVPEYAFDALAAQMKSFQGTLSLSHELGIIANGGGAVLHVENLFSDGQMFVFDGVDGEGRRSRLIQHYTQVNVQMVSVDKIQDKPRRIGF